MTLKCSAPRGIPQFPWFQWPSTTSPRFAKRLRAPKSSAFAACAAVKKCIVQSDFRCGEAPFFDKSHKSPSLQLLQAAHGASGTKCRQSQEWRAVPVSICGWPENLSQGGGINCYLVGGIPTPLKNMKVNWDDDIPNSHGKISQSCSSHHQPVMISWPICIS